MRERILPVLRCLEELSWRKEKEQTGLRYCPGDYHYERFFSAETMPWEPWEPDQTWGGRDRHFWFTATVTAEDGIPGKPFYAFVETGADDEWNTDNPQIMVYCNGELDGTLDMNHRSYCLSECLSEGDRFELAFYAYSNAARKTNFFMLKTAALEEPVFQTAMDLRMLWEAAGLLTEEEPDYQAAASALSYAIKTLELSEPYTESFYSSLEAVRSFLKARYFTDIPEKGQGKPVVVHSIGHTHIDIAWKWQVKQTRQKAVRSFQTVLKLMKKYPEYRFFSSQPQLYQFVQEDAPWLFAQLKERIREGRWEADGGMWLESDCNIPSGESFVRQLLYGTRYFQEELGAEPNEILWLPDVFGYSAALPQLMRQFGLRYFVTTKLGWNDHDQFPYDTFRWRGIDGSEVLAYLITTTNYEKEPRLRRSFSTTYNGLQNPKQIKGTWQRYQNKALSRNVLTVFGYGDGGGGTTETMLEQDRRLRYGIAGCPVTKQGSVKEFFHTLEREMNPASLPTWVGELYLEYHRGTYTSMAEMKRENRQCEYLLQKAELWAVLRESILREKAAVASDFTEERREGLGDRKTGRESFRASETGKLLERSWKRLLLNQFHDILPGSGIREVYEDAFQGFSALREELGAFISGATEEYLRHEKLQRLECRGEASQGAGPEREELQGSDLMRGELHAVILNPEGFRRREPLIIKGENAPALSALPASSERGYDGSVLLETEEIPGKSIGLYSVRKAEGLPLLSILEEAEETGVRSFETPFYCFSINAQGELTRLYDKEEERELLKAGESGNKLTVYQDKPLEYDAWNIDEGYREKCWELTETSELSVVENGRLRAGIRIEKRFLDSKISQTLLFYRHTKRIDFVTELDWHQHQMLLKAAFPVDILTEKAVYDIQFGTVERPNHYNTSWDQARFEVCAHQWGDLSEAGFGIALLNDGRYGYSIHDSVMELTLLKSGIFPNPDADQGQHRLTYSLFPHKGSYREGRVIQEAAALNDPLEGFLVSGDGRPSSLSLLESDNDNILIGAVKPAENGDGVIARLTELHGRRGKAMLRSGYFTEAEETDLPEKARGEKQQLQQGCLTLSFRPFEVKTLRLRKGF